MKTKASAKDQNALIQATEKIFMNHWKDMVRVEGVTKDQVDRAFEQIIDNRRITKTKAIKRSYLVSIGCSETEMEEFFSARYKVFGAAEPNVLT